MSALAILTKCPLANCLLAKCPLAKCPLAKCHGFHQGTSVGVTSGCSATARGVFPDFEAQIPPVAIFPVRRSFRYIRYCLTTHDKFQIPL